MRLADRYVPLPLAMKGSSMRTLLAAGLLIGLPSANALAQDLPPPQGAKPLSQLLQTIEKSADFAYIDEVDWDDGVFKVEYFTQAGAKKKIRIDPVTGNERPSQR
jgi:hypothetical protein